MTATTKTRKASTKAQKTVTVLYTYIFKHLNRVCFTVLSYEGQHKVDRDERIVEADTYNTCFNNGKGSCTCRANAEFHLECYHIKQLADVAKAKLEAKESARPAWMDEADAYVESLVAKTEKDANLQAEWGSPVYDEAYYNAKFKRMDAMNAAYNRQLTPIQCKSGLYVPEVIEAGRKAVEEAQKVFDAECKVVNQKFDNWSKANGYEPLPAIVDEEYEAWKKATGHDRNMSRVEYDMEFDPNGLNL